METAAQSLNALTNQIRQKYGDWDGKAERVAIVATAETKAAVLDGTAGKPLVITGELVSKVFHQAGRQSGKAPGLDAMTYEVLALLGEATAQAFAQILNQWCQTWRSPACPARGRPAY